MRVPDRLGRGLNLFANGLQQFAVVVSARLLAGHMKGVKAFDARPQSVGQRVPAVGRAREHGRHDRWVDLHGVQRQELTRVVRPHHVGVKEQPSVRRAATRLLVGDEEGVGRRVGVLITRRGPVLADQHPGEMRLKLTVDVDASKQQQAPLVERRSQLATRLLGELGLRIQAQNLRAKRRGEILDFQLSHRLLLGRMTSALYG